MKKANVVEITLAEECRSIFLRDFAVIFKHSRQCGRSLHAYRTVLKFCEEGLQTQIYLISVLDVPVVAQLVETLTGVHHESPQVLALRNGKVYAHASHRNITPAFMEALMRLDAPREN